ncbi:Zn(2)-C6 fungal-type domain-containing protein [Trichoderma simmonsii]|uniref:Zn(2)-C6 fungal-type domain-containing protein n=1 Tax=Trichoderma simmonsii TaxID=1491479 RepID=A0A8G0LQU4_9HYPO|nr:Zn(2)-C6 fungal-type domain-containing protein [Trichoderma simmonsii]
MARGRACAQWWPSSSKADISPIPRRTRASRPKVRTGCGTWKRRVKCGEERPQCLRCISGGYICDSYNGGTSAAPDLHVRCEFIFSGPDFEARQRSCGFRIITATIDGTNIEKRYFHEFKNVAAQGNIYEPDCQLNRFFSRVCTQISHKEIAVKHAMVALGSAYQLLQQTYPTKSSSTLEDLELFTAGQYGRALVGCRGLSAQASQETITCFYSSSAPYRSSASKPYERTALSRESIL